MRPPPEAVSSPDGKTVVWIAGDRSGVWSARAGSSDPELLLTVHGAVSDLVFSPDGDQLAFVNARTTGNERHGYTDHSFIAVFRFGSDRLMFVDPAYASDSEPEWSADGRAITFVRRVPGVPEQRLVRPVPESGARLRPTGPPPSEPYPIEAVLAAPFVYDLTTSADGRTLAYLSRESTGRHVYARGEDGVTRRVVEHSDDGQELGSLVLSPGGKALAYVRGGQPGGTWEAIPNPISRATPPERELWIASSDGRRRWPIDAGAQVVEPQFAPSGDRLVWSAASGVMSAALSWTPDGELDVVGEPVCLFALPTAVRMLRMSPDGRHIAWERDGGVELGDVTTGEHARLTAAPGVQFATPAWSPDGTRIALRRTAVGEPWSISVADVPSLALSEVWQAAPGRGEEFYALDQEDQLLWSRDDRIAFAWERDGWRHLYAIPATGGPARLLTPGEGEVEFAGTTFDQSGIVYVTNIGDLGRRHVWSVGFDGETCEPLTQGKYSAWAPTPLAGGPLAVIQATWCEPPAVVVLDVDADVEQTLLPQVPASFPAAHLVEPAVISFDAADGEVAFGQLFVPFEPNGSAIVFPHGGPRRSMLPEWHYGEVYAQLFAFNQYLASQGCVVLSVDYRSGTMRGHDFREASASGRAGASEYNDILGAAHYLAGRPDVDPGRIGIHGLSWGGYLTALALARDSDVFSVGFDQAGVHEFFGEQFPHSPMASIDAWSSPVYVAHGDDDRNVRFSQAVLLARALRVRGVELVEHVFPDETHEMHATFDNLITLYGGGARFLLDHLGA
jgi:dipeptidyl aminopeptidase/acylaminoacyl peptidase